MPPSQLLRRRAQLELVLLNLIANARDAMPDGGVVEISATNRTLREGEAELAGDFVGLSVRDHGCGIDPDVLGRVWEPFFTTKGAGKGTGLGLATVDGFARQSGGFAQIESEVGAGTAITIYLPKGAGLRPAEVAPVDAENIEVVVPFPLKER